MIQHTLSIIKPDAVAANNIGAIIDRLEKNYLQVVAQKMVLLTKEQAEGFYAEHKERPFFQELVSYMTSGAVVLQVLAGEDAVAVNRRVMGATDPKQAEVGTIRRDFGTSLSSNAVHGSDSITSAQREINYFFSPEEQVR